MFFGKIFFSKYFGLKKYLKRILDKLDGMRNIATPNELVIYNSLFFARVAELVDAADSKSAVRKDVLVRFQSRALIQK